MSVLARALAFLRLVEPPDVARLPDAALAKILDDDRASRELRADAAREIVRRQPRPRPARVVIDGPVCRDVQRWIMSVQQGAPIVARVLVDPKPVALDPPSRPSVALPPSEARH